MMTTASTQAPLDDLKRQGVTIEVHGDTLRLNIPLGILHRALVERLAAGENADIIHRELLRDVSQAIQQIERGGERPGVEPATGPGPAPVSQAEAGRAVESGQAQSPSANHPPAETETRVEPPPPEAPKPGGALFAAPESPEDRDVGSVFANSPDAIGRSQLPRGLKAVLGNVLKARRVIRELYRYAIAPDGGRKPRRGIVYAVLDSASAAEVRDRTGLDISDDARHVIDSYGIWHTHNKHGGESERLRGQEPLVEDDFAFIPDVTQPENIVGTGVDDLGNPVIIYRKRRNGHFYVAQEVRKGRNELALQSAWKQKNGGRASTDEQMTQKSPAPSSKTLQGARPPENDSATQSSEVKPGELPGAGTPKDRGFDAGTGKTLASPETPQASPDESSGGSRGLFPPANPNAPAGGEGAGETPETNPYAPLEARGGKFRRTKKDTSAAVKRSLAQARADGRESHDADNIFQIVSDVARRLASNIIGRNAKRAFRCFQNVTVNKRGKR